LPAAKDWSGMMADHAQLLEDRTGHGVAEWNERVLRSGAGTEDALRQWLESQGVTGYPQRLLVMERFGYPDFLVASADELIDSQYADRPQLRTIFESILLAVGPLHGAEVQARKTKVSLMTPKRKFAEVVPTTKNRVDLFLRIEGEEPSGRLRHAAPRAGDVMNLKVGLSGPEEVDESVAESLVRAFQANC
jgi:hypothetical protein